MLTEVSVDDKFVSDTSDIDNADTFVLTKFMSQFSDEHVQAARIEETVVTPKIEQDILGIHYLITVFAQAFQDFGLAVGEFLLYSGMGQYLCDRVEW